MQTIEDLIGRLSTLPEESRKIVEADVLSATGDLKFIPSPGPQTDAYFSRADVLLYGGEPGGGKTGLLIGLALNEHERSLIVRKQFADLEGVIDNAKEMVGSDKNFVGGSRPKYKKSNGGVIHFQGMAQTESLDTSKQGTPHDFIGVDEGAQLPENAVRLLLGWLRTKTQGQRCRMVIASNPPVDTTGDWLASFFAPWLDDKHLNPAKPGELRWFIIGPDGESQEVDGPATVVIEGIEYSPHSRTFIRASVEDNPFLNAEDYRKNLQALPEPYRSILLSGNFLSARTDMEWQVIPTEWVRLAQARWLRSRRPADVPMCAMGVDPARGGKDKMIISPRYDGWFEPLITIAGVDVPDGQTAAGHVIKHRKDGAHVVIDAVGIGSSPLDQLRANDIKLTAYNGGGRSSARTKDKTLKFYNKRAESWWKFREALDPAQDGGSPIMLPDDPELLSDLCTPCIKNPAMMQAQGILLESKEDIKKRIQRSPDKGDAVVLAWALGDKVANIQGGWSARAKGNQPSVVLGHQHQRRSRL